MARPRRSQATRERLLTEGVAALLENGYHGTGIQEVVNRAQVPKGSFYNYFASKEDFAAHVIQFYAECFAKQLREALDEASDPLDGLRGFFRALMSDFEKNGYVGGCLIANLGGELEGSSVCRDQLRAGFTGWSDVVAEVLRDGQARKVVRRDVEARELAALLTEAWEGAVIRMKIEQSVESLERVVHHLLDGYILSKS